MLDFEEEKEETPIVEDTFEINEEILPGLDDMEEDDVLPGMEDEEIVEEDEEFVPGLDDEDDDVLPGMEDEEIVEEDDEFVPGLDDEDEEFAYEILDQCIEIERKVNICL